MTIAFPNRGRSYDASAKHIRFLGHDGMFEIRFFVEIDILTKGPFSAASSERDYLTAFDSLRTRIFDVAERVYASKRKSSIILKLADFR
ncbi:hypothetical protein A6U86_10230 [Rhizobium sp. AC27/96]|uniref:DUF1488 domain-containing protein n=1 Tax=Rhizobium sp. AC27/96 TaxID=1841653 RepID=UPI000827DD20|nr:DUF1488 domain-containing protein [Rhizobium sp. AC27/96]OCJ07417.1 hypothetical protein A6U86_10230 [Rhizobium sp. AC27/96]